MPLDSNTITVSYHDGQEQIEKTFSVLPTAYIGIGQAKAKRKGDPGPVNSKLSDIPVGANVTLKLSPDQKNVVSIAAEGGSHSGTVKSVDAGKNTLTLTLFVRKGEPGEDRTFTVGNDVTVAIDGKEAKLADLPVAATASIKLSVDQKNVLGIWAEGPVLSGTVKSVDAAQGHPDAGDRQGRRADRFRGQECSDRHRRKGRPAG